MTHVIDEQERADEQPIPDSELCDLIRAGEAWPLATLWERYYARAVAWARRKDQENAEDATSEAFDAIYRSLLAGGGPTESFPSYLFRTVNTQLSKHWKASGRELSLDDFDAALDDDDSGEDAHAQREEQVAAIAALGELPLRWQRIILEVDVGGKPVHEVAIDLELTPNSTSVLLKRAREGLRRSWLKQMHPPRGLAPECEACVNGFTEVRWGRKGSRKAAQATAHIDSCPRCRSRWQRFAEQASVIGMVSTGVLAMHRGWKRKAVIAAAALASVGVLAVAAGVAMPALQSTTPLPAEVGEYPARGDNSREDAMGSGDTTSGGTREATGKPDSRSGGAGDSSSTQPGGNGAGGDAETLATVPDLASVSGGFAEIPNTAQVNVNDLDVDGDGSPGARTNTVWTRWGVANAVKVDSSNPKRGLAGAQFILWASEVSEGCAGTAELTRVTDTNGGPLTITSGSGGVLDLPPLWIGDDETDGGEYSSGLTARCYVLEETQAPAGYELPEGPAAQTEIIVRGWDAQETAIRIAIPNEAEPLPWLARTGAVGVTLVGGGGVFLLASGIVLVASRPRQR